MPFTEETLDFMALNRVMNSREWFHEHKDEYKRLVVSPMAELLDAIAPGMLEIDPSLIIVPRPGKSVSRLWRDTRRGPELPLYRDVLWFDLKRGKYLDYPGFWFELSPRALRWGCGWYQTEPATVAAARELILAGDPDWKRALEALDYHPAFGFNYDPSHLGYQGVDYVQFIYTFADRIFHVHMKDVWWSDKPMPAGVFGGHLPFGDVDRYWDFRSMGRGKINFEEIIRALNRINYQGPLSVEWEDSGMDREHGAAESLRFVKSIDFKPSTIAFDAGFEK